MERHAWQMTIEHLGSDATQEDLYRFRAACANYLEKHECSEQEATDAVGQYHNGLGRTREGQLWARGGRAMTTPYPKSERVRAAILRLRLRSERPFFLNRYDEDLDRLVARRQLRREATQ